MTDIADVADLAQYTLSDEAANVWPQATVEYWVLEAIRDYSIHFHRTKTDSLNCPTGYHQYDLPRDFIDAILVEYPDGEDPPQHLNRLPRTDPRFWASPDFYDLELLHQMGSGNESQIWISADAATGETISLTYLSAYYDPAATPIPDVVVEVPDRHIPILIAFVEWKAASERLFDELQDPDRTIHLIEGMKRTVEEKREAYETMIAAALAESVRSGWISRWHMDTNDRIY
jgi:hypothetical protein